MPDSNQLISVSPAPCTWVFVLFSLGLCLGGISGRREASFWTMEKGSEQEEGCSTCLLGKWGDPWVLHNRPP